MNLKLLGFVFFFIVCIYLTYWIKYKRYIPKIIWIFWEQGWENAPDICKICLSSWKKYNSDWKIIALSKQNISQYIDMSMYVERFWEREPIQSRSDLIRTNLLNKFGGVWTDATLFCTKPLKMWLFDTIKSSHFFAFANPTKDKMISNWFLVSSKNSYIMSTWCNKFNTYWKTNKQRTDNYFMHVMLFRTLYENDSYFKKLWDNVPKKSASGPHKLKVKDRYTKPNDEIKEHIIGVKSPIYKLDHNVNTDRELNNENVYSFLIKHHSM